MALEIYLNFNGNCREAINYYAQVFETETPEIMTFGDAPPHPDHILPEEAKNLVMHSRFEINGSTMMFSDVFPGMPFIVGNNISLAYVNENLEDVTSKFNKLKEDGKVGMELQETFWSKSYGSLTDKFGIEWQFNYGSM
ncbi:VOC family protein [Paenisporosarcina indica]|uniref:VOC family protein n=1 Tax=Paenisporosarcina indica TaxID=650093 RepID=UPI00094FE8BE|nr:VOC family protein [Paenisporosarcina indica]